VRHFFFSLSHFVLQHQLASVSATEALPCTWRVAHSLDADVLELITDRVPASELTNLVLMIETGTALVSFQKAQYSHIVFI
jgi:hypothetical protein